MEIPEIDVHEAKRLLDAGDAVFMDVRDPHSYAAAHVPGAVHVDDRNLNDFLATTERSRTVVVYCYHGNSSLGGTHYLLSQGFDKAMSLRGGFDAWRSVHGEVS